MRILNLYAGIGGNRALWGGGHEITSVESDPQVATAYRELWPGDAVVETDAHQFLLEHLRDGWDFVWSSPPCQSHSKLNQFEAGKGRLRYPDAGLWQEIVLFQKFAPPGTRWLVENVIPYYPPLDPAHGPPRPALHLVRGLPAPNRRHETGRGEPNRRRVTVEGQDRTSPRVENRNMDDN